MAKRKSHDNNKARLTARERATGMIAWMCERGAGITIQAATEHFEKTLQAHARATLDRAKRRAR